MTVKVKVILQVLTMLFVVALVSWAGYLRFAKDYVWADGTGLREKTLWDWLELLIVPVVLALGALWFNKTEKENEQNIATDRQREAALQNYIDKMTELLLSENHTLRASAGGSEVRVVARTRTLATLRTLDPLRKGMLIRFLYEAGLISNEKVYIDLEGADLSGAKLSEANLSGARLFGTNLRRADLFGTDLRRADMRSANLSEARLTGADLRGTDLSGAGLFRADLRVAHLIGADLSKTYLREARLSGANLSGADLSGVNLSGANLNRADLNGADLSWADLKGAKVERAQWADQPP